MLPSILVEDPRQLGTVIKQAVRKANLTIYDNETLLQLTEFLQDVSMLFENFTGYAIDVNADLQEVYIVFLFKTKYFDTNHEPDAELTPKMVEEIYSNIPKLAVRLTNTPKKTH